MRSNRVRPTTWDILTNSSNDKRGPCAESTTSKVISPIVARALAAMRQRLSGGGEANAKQWSSCGGTAQAGEVECMQSGDWAADGPGISTAERPAYRLLHRQHNSLPHDHTSPQQALPLRRAISAGGGHSSGARAAATGTTGAATAAADAVAKAASAAASAAAVRRGAGYSSDAGPAPTVSGTAAAPPAPAATSLLSALQSFAAVSEGTVTALRDVREQHEELLQQQRESFQRLLVGMRARSSNRRASTGTTSSAAGTTPPVNSTTRYSAPGATAAPSSHSTSAPLHASLCNPAGGYHRAASVALSSGPVSHSQPSTTPQPSAEMEPQTITESYRDSVSVTMPIGCRLEGTGDQLLVMGPRVHVELAFRDGEARHPVLVSSSCVATVKRVDGRTVVTVLAPLLDRSKSQS